MNRKLRQKIIAFTGLGITAVIVAMFSVSHLRSDISNFSDSYQNIVTQVRQLTQSYQSEMGKWQSKQYDNITMIKITNTYLPRFQKLINNIESLQSTPKFENTKDFYAKSLESEMLSYKNFRNYLLTLQTSAKLTFQYTSAQEHGAAAIPLGDRLYFSLFWSSKYEVLSHMVISQPVLIMCACEYPHLEQNIM